MPGDNGAAVSRSVPSGYLIIDEEIVRYGEKKSASFRDVRRGEFGTIPVTHGAGTRVRQFDPGIDRSAIGEFAGPSVQSEAVSLPRSLGSGPSGTVFTDDLEIDPAETIFESEPHTEPGGIVFWERASDSLDDYGQPAAFGPGILDAGDAPIGAFYRFRSVLRSSRSTDALPVIDEIRLRYRMPR